ELDGDPLFGQSPSLLGLLIDHPGRVPIHFVSGSPHVLEDCGLFVRPAYTPFVLSDTFFQRLARLPFVSGSTLGTGDPIHYIFLVHWIDGFFYSHEAVT